MVNGIALKDWLKLAEAAIRKDHDSKHEAATISARGGVAYEGGDDFPYLIYGRSISALIRFHSTLKIFWPSAVALLSSSLNLPCGSFPSCKSQTSCLVASISSVWSFSVGFMKSSIRFSS